MSNLTFRGVVLEYPDLRRKEASVFVRVHFSAELTKPVSEAMAWGELPESITGAKLSGDLTADKFILSPGDKKLKDFELQLQCSRVEDFSVARVKSDDGEGIMTRLRFLAIVESVGAIAEIENWMRNIGGGEAVLKVSYIEQDTLDLKPGGPQATDEQRHSAMEIPVDHVVEAIADRLMHGGPTLAPAPAMGGTHQRKTRRPRNQAAEAFADGSGEEAIQ